MEREQIIKALNVCANNGSCKECPINPNYGNFGYCTSLAINHALALIEELTEENEKLMLEKAGFEAGARCAAELIKADTVRKMHERFKMYFGTYVLGYKITLSEALKAVDKIAKEMLEGNENGQRENN